MSTSNPYRGVSWHVRNQRWRAKIKVLGTHVALGQFESAEEAAKVWDCAARLARGPGADINFHGEPPETVAEKDIRALLRAKLLLA